MITRSLGPAVALALVLSNGCTDDRSQTGPSLPSSLDAAVAGSVSGHLLGPDNTSLCNALPAGSVVRVQLLVAPPGGAAVAGTVDQQCPENAYSIPVADGTYMLRLTLPVDPGIGTLPQRDVFLSPVVVAGADIVRDIQVVPGDGLGGRVTLDGVPLPGIDLNLRFDALPGYAGISGASGVDGGWVDLAGREPMILQSGLSYRFLTHACEALGTRVVEGPTQESFAFPTEVGSINCALANAPAITFSHVRTRLAVTPMPGDFGGLSSELLDQFGMGWGAQFPAPPIHSSRSVSQLYLGGLMVAVRPDRVLSGIDFSGYGDCGPSCRDFGLDGTLTYTNSARSGTRVLWRYSDAPSAESVGLRVAQESYDGVPPHDYVLFHFSFTNTSRASLTFYAGLFADWDVDQMAGNNIGATAQGGRIMYVTVAPPGGDYVGTVLLGNYPVSGNRFYAGNLPQTVADQVGSLDGEIRTPTAPTFGDQRYIHALGPITLKAGRSGDMWIALVAGQTRNQFFANASAATADVSRRGSDSQSYSAPGLNSIEVARTASSQGNHALEPYCKKGCMR